MRKEILTILRKGAKVGDIVHTNPYRADCFLLVAIVVRNNEALFYCISQSSFLAISPIKLNCLRSFSAIKRSSKLKIYTSKWRGSINAKNQFDGDILIGVYSVLVNLNHDLYAMYSYDGSFEMIAHRNNISYFYVEVVGGTKVEIARKLLNKIHERAAQGRVMYEGETKVITKLESICQTHGD